MTFSVLPDSGEKQINREFSERMLRRFFFFPHCRDRGGAPPGEGRIVPPDSSDIRSFPGGKKKQPKGQEEMGMKKYTAFLALITAVLLACGCCAAAFAEDAAAAGNEPAQEETAVNWEMTDEGIAHSLWGFFIGWAQGDMERMLILCTSAWRYGKEEPGQELLKILGSDKVRGYRINSISGKDGDLSRTVSVTVQRETESGECTCSLYEIPCLQEAETDMYAGFDPEGFGAGVPAEPVPEEELVLLTAEGQIRSAIEMHQEEEDLYDNLVPVHAVTEGQGIRMEVISGLVKEGKAWFLVSLEDTEGKYAGCDLSPTFTGGIDGSDFNWWSRVCREGKKSVYLVNRETEQPVLPEEGSVTLGISDLWVRKSETVSLTPFLKQYGKAVEGIPHPVLEDRSHAPEIPEVPEDVKVLDYHQPLDVFLYGDVYLTGIGWIGDQLHIQFHHRGTEYVEMTNGRGSACSVWVDGFVRGRGYNATYIDYSPIYWDGNNNGWTEWTEYIMNCKPEEAEQVTLSAEITLTEAILEADWKVTIPLETVRESSGT